MHEVVSVRLQLSNLCSLIGNLSIMIADTAIVTKETASDFQRSLSLSLSLSLFPFPHSGRKRLNFDAGGSCNFCKTRRVRAENLRARVTLYPDTLANSATRRVETASLVFRASFFFFLLLSFLFSFPFSFCLSFFLFFFSDLPVLPALHCKQREHAHPEQTSPTPRARSPTCKAPPLISRSVQIYYCIDPIPFPPATFLLFSGILVLHFSRFRETTNVHRVC